MGIQAKTTKLPDSEAEIHGELAWADFAKYRPASLDHFKKEAKIDGFRPGTAPEHIVVGKVGEDRILFHMAEAALGEHYPKLLMEHKLDAIGQPEITITKIAVDNPLGFKIKTALVPEVTLPDYAVIAKKLNKEKTGPTEVSEEMITKALEDFRQSQTKPDAPAPDLSDDFAKSLGLNNLEELKTKVKEELTLRAKQQAEGKHRVALLDALAAATTVALPPLLVEREKNMMLAELKLEIERMGMKLPDYLTHLKQTEESLKETWANDAKKRVITGLVLEKIAVAEKLMPTETELDTEADHLAKHHPQAARASLINYLKGVLMNDKVIAWLEKLA